MLKKTITYTDYDGTERTEDFYFNLSKAELAQMELGTTGGMQQRLEKIIAAKDNRQILEVFKEIILGSYGEKTPDGKRFMKSKEIAEAFEQTEAFSELFMELATSEEAATAFISGIIPASMSAELAKTNA